MCKKRIKIDIEIDVPDFCNDSFIRRLALLDEREFAIIDEFIKGFLLKSGKIALEEAIYSDKIKKD